MKIYRKYAAISVGLALATALAVVLLPGRPVNAGEAPKKTAAELEKEKAMKNPYPNDIGPEKLDEATLKDYPADKKAGYELAMVKCAQCHSSARPLNSRFVEPEGKDAAVSALKKSNPELFKDGAVWQIEGSVWNRYVKRMMSKPGCKISNAEGKKIWEFFVYDGSKRKIGANAQKWQAHRKKLLADFKAKYPQRYEELAKDKDL
ncbi:MAG: hypothetical protein A3J74_07840 [Elusimicrobia bacterium RIFCSPHIGHO2_02_FULL_57_9]|nr:MAG: hypothetical protein A3J74_07840 [Elusimicrobia bacterium RIFCSPHIGHO2_02_FULL_57_9]